MRPEARIAAAIEVLDDILAGQPAERCLTTWARQHRFAGSKDRLAIRDLVFDALRRMRSYAWLGGNATGRGLMLGRLRALGEPVDATFSGEQYAPEPLSVAERLGGGSLEDAPEAVRLDCQDWLWPKLDADLGSDATAILETLQDRAPVFLRVNTAKIDRANARAALAAEGIEAEAHSLTETALRVLSGERKVRGSEVFTKGWVELQDVASQAAASMAFDHLDGDCVLDFCAGGGGKALAFAAAGAQVVAHDRDPGRMADIPERARRAGVKIEVSKHPEGLFDLVFCDAPCSGSGAWRRQPQAKWSLTPERLAELCALQDVVLEAAFKHVRPDGILAYATCSLLSDENAARIDYFLTRHDGWTRESQKQWTPLDGGDGFFFAALRRS